MNDPPSFVEVIEHNHCDIRANSLGHRPPSKKVIHLYSLLPSELRSYFHNDKSSITVEYNLLWNESLRCYLVMLFSPLMVAANSLWAGNKGNVDLNSFQA